MFNFLLGPQIRTLSSVSCVFLERCGHTHEHTCYKCTPYSMRNNKGQRIRRRGRVNLSLYFFLLANSWTGNKLWFVHTYAHRFTVVALVEEEYAGKLVVTIVGSCKVMSVT